MKKYKYRVKKIDDFEEEAENFLRKYGFEQCISEPQPVPIEKIAQKMSLTVEYGFTLSLDSTIQGAVTFSDGVMKVFDSKKNPVDYAYHKGTVFVCAALSSSTGRNRNTLAHECFHWYMHRDYFTHQLSSNRMGNGLSHECKSDSIPLAKAREKYSATDWAEWQARQIAPKILMPKVAVQRFLDQKKDSLPQSDKDWSVFLSQMSRIFQVSKQSACLRLIDMDTPDAQRYYSSHYSSGISQGGTRRVTQIDALGLYMENELLREKVFAGEYCYTSDGYFAIMEPKYVEKSSRGYILTEYAKKHLPECTVFFHSNESEDNKSQDVPGVPFRKDPDKVSLDATVSGSHIHYPRDPDRYISPDDKLSTRVADLKKTLQGIPNISRSAGADIGERILQKDWNWDDFVAATCLGKNRYYDFKHCYDFQSCNTSSPGKENFTLNSYLAACHALQMDYFDLTSILAKTDYSLKPNIPQHIAYQFCFIGLQDCSVEQCDFILSSAGLRTLSGSERKNRGPKDEKDWKLVPQYTKK